MLDMLVEVLGSELEVVLAQENKTIYLTKTHIADLKAVIEIDQSMEGDESADSE